MTCSCEFDRVVYVGASVLVIGAVCVVIVVVVSVDVGVLSASEDIAISSVNKSVITKNPKLLQI